MLNLATRCAVTFVLRDGQTGGAGGSRGSAGGGGNDCAVKKVTSTSDSRLSILTAEHAITGAAAELWIVDQPGRRAGDDDPDPDLRPGKWATRSAKTVGSP